MKILHIIDSLGMGGAENVLIGLTDGQKKQGHSVTVMPLVCAEHTPVRDRMETNLISVQPFAEKGSVYRPVFIRKIVKELSYYDVVHVHLFPAFYWAGFAKILSGSKIPLIYTEHSTNNKRRNNLILRQVDKLVYQYGYNKVVACAGKVLDTYKAAFPSIKRVCAINNGVDTNIYKNAESYNKKELLGIEEDCFLVTMVARFMTMKRQDTIVEAIAKTPKRIHAVFVGGNETDEGLIRVKKMTEEMGLSDRVHFLYIRNDVPRILKTSDVIIMASDYEGLSLSSIEGMAAGKPFIATNVNGLREIVGGYGLLFENKDSETLSQIINKLASDNSFYHEIAQKCSLRANDFDLKLMVEGYLNVYKEVMTNND